jgi:hypothetical protein
MTAKRGIHKQVKVALGFKPSQSDKEILKKCKAAISRFCKPCWELKYCPYGPLVEQFPTLPPIRTEAITHNERLKGILKNKKLGDGRKLDAGRKKLFTKQVKTFNAKDYPEEIPEAIQDMACNIFGHICPVVFSAEGFTETSSERRRGRYIPFATKIRVVRRDNHTCQHCGKHLRDDEVEFDHVIPIARGGSSEEHNIRLTCFDCNREKTDRVEL